MASGSRALLNLHMMKMVLLLLASAAPLHAATVIIDNAHHSAVVTTGSQSSFGRQSFTFTIAGGTAGNASSHDNVAANSPLTSLVTLESIAFVESPTDNASATAGNLFLKVFSDAGATGAPVAVSSNSINVRGAINGGALSDLVWNFASVSLNSAPEYFIRWSTNSSNDNTGLAVGRVAAANFGGGFVDTYTGGAATNPAGSVLAFDARFEVTFITVPEPGTAMLGLLAGAAMLRRRRV